MKQTSTDDYLSWLMLDFVCGIVLEFVFRESSWVVGQLWLNADFAVKLLTYESFIVKWKPCTGHYKGYLVPAWCLSIDNLLLTNIYKQLSIWITSASDRNSALHIYIPKLNLKLVIRSSVGFFFGRKWIWICGRAEMSLSTLHFSLGWILRGKKRKMYFFEKLECLDRNKVGWDIS